MIRAGGLVEIMRRTGVNMTLSDAEALLSICMWPAFPLSESDRVNAVATEEGGCGVAAPSLEKWLCCLGSYRYIQVKMRVYMKALAPSLCIDFLKGIKMQDDRGGFVSKDKFVDGIEASGAPLSRAEAQALAELLMRQKPASKSRTPNGGHPRTLGSRKSAGGEGGWSWLRENFDEAESNVEVGRLDRICKGDFFSAIL